MSKGYVLDASAILCLINGEAGAARVEEALPGSVISAVNVSEVAAKLCEFGLDAETVESLLLPLHLTVHPFDAKAAYRAGALRQATRARGLSFGDRACVALAKELDLPTLTADKGWRDIQNDAGVTVELLR